jgi:hypothetical protein
VKLVASRGLERDQIIFEPRKVRAHHRCGPDYRTQACSLLLSVGTR